MTRRVDTLLASARGRLGPRPSPEAAADAVAAGALLVDIRPVEQRDRDGTVPDAVIVDRNVLEWRLDPASPWCIPEAADGPPVIILCNEGYQSSLAAAACLDSGCTSATDVDGGFQAWRAAGMPVDEPQAVITPKVAVEAVLFDDAGRALYVERGSVGGWVEPGEHPADAVVRHARAAGLEVTVGDVVGVSSDGSPSVVSIAYRANVTGGQLLG